MDASCSQADIDQILVAERDDDQQHQFNFLLCIIIILSKGRTIVAATVHEFITLYPLLKISTVSCILFTFRIVRKAVIIIEISREDFTRKQLLLFRRKKCIALEVGFIQPHTLVLIIVIASLIS